MNMYSDVHCVTIPKLLSLVSLTINWLNSICEFLPKGWTSSIFFLVSLLKDLLLREIYYHQYQYFSWMNLMSFDLNFLLTWNRDSAEWSFEKAAIDTTKVCSCD